MQKDEPSFQKTEQSETNIEITIESSTSSSCVAPSTTHNFGSNITINGQKASPEDAERVLGQIFGKPVVTITNT